MESTIKRLLLCALLGCCAPWTLAQSTIVHVPHSIHAFRLWFDHSGTLDMNQDGVTDFSLSMDPSICTTDYPSSLCSQPMSLHISPSNSILTDGSLVANIPPGEWIGPSEAPNATWTTQNTATVMIFWNSPRNFTSGIRGSFGETGQGYAGVRFTASDGIHYGWAFVQKSAILEWAYESRPNLPIRAGAKPVPVALSQSSIQRPNFLRLTAETATNKAYQVQVKTNLQDFAWSNLDFVLPANSPHTSIDIPTANPKAFYRIVEAD